MYNSIKPLKLRYIYGYTYLNRLFISLSFLCIVESSSDNIYFAANFKSTDSMSYDISYQQVNVNSTEGSVSTSRLYGWQEGDEFWLSCESLRIMKRKPNYIFATRCEVS